LRRVNARARTPNLSEDDRLAFSDRYVIEARGPATGAYLYRFPVGSAELHDEHRRWLDSRVIGAMAIKAGFSWLGPVAKLDMRLWIAGLTSRTGSFADNLDLARARIDAVRGYVRQRLGPGVTLPVHSLDMGEAPAFMAGEKNDHENPSYRATYVQLSVTRPAQLPTPAKPPPVKRWRSLMLWLDVDFLNLGPIRRMNGALVGSIDGDMTSWLAWNLGGTQAQAGIPVKGEPPIGTGSLNTTGVTLQYDPDIFDPATAFAGKAATFRMHGKTVKMVVRNLLPRQPSASYEPLNGVAERSVELEFINPDTEASISGGYVTLGRVRRVKGKGPSMPKCPPFHKCTIYI
jgi:hypothetical protein